MLRTTNLIWVLLLGVVAGMLFRVSFQVQHLEKQLAETQHEISEERQSIRVLDAEWAYLNGPDRIEQLAQHYLSLTPTLARQMAPLEAIPQKPAEGTEVAVAARSAAPAHPHPAAPALPAQDIVYHTHAGASSPRAGASSE